MSNTQINYIKDNIVEIRTTEKEYIEQMREEAGKDDTILQCEQWGDELRILIEIDKSEGGSSFLRYIH